MGQDVCAQPEPRWDRLYVSPLMSAIITAVGFGRYYCCLPLLSLLLLMSMCLVHLRSELDAADRACIKRFLGGSVTNCQTRHRAAGAFTAIQQH
jgi:hypothetical protein